MQMLKTGITASLCLALFSANAQAALESRADGTMVYDTDLDITWIADANLFKYQADWYFLGSSAFVDNIISQVNFVTPPSGFPGDEHFLDASDFDTQNGAMTWWGAQAWVSTLDFGGFTGWRLPNANDACGGYACSEGIDDGELGHLFSNELNGIPGYSILTTWSDPDYSLFTNLQSSVYWTGFERFAADYAIGFDNNTGLQDQYTMDSYAFVWAVHDGDIAAPVPLPAAAWLFNIGLLSLLGLNRRQKLR